MAVAFVQDNSAKQFSGTSFTVGLTGVTAGNLIVVAVYAADSTATPSVSSSIDGSLTSTTAPTTLGSPSGAAQIFYLANASSGDHTFTVTPGASVYSTAIATEISGADTSAPYDTSAGNAQSDPGTGTDAVTSTAITPSVNGAYLYGYTQGMAGTTPVAGTGWTDRQSDGGARTEEIIQATAASQAATFTNVNAFEDNITIIAAFKPAGGGGGTTYDESAADTMVATDIPGGTLTMSASASDGMSASDGPLSQLNMVASASDSIIFSDVPTQGGALQLTATDGITFTAASSALYIIASQVSDSVTMSDSPSGAFTLSATVTDGVTFSQLVSAAMVMLATASDGVSFSDVAIDTTFLSSGIIRVTITSAQATVTITARQGAASITASDPGLSITEG